MAKKICSHCGKEMGLFSLKVELEDGWLCAECVASIKKVGMIDIEDKISSMKFLNIKEIYDKKKILAEKFEKDFQIGEMLIIDNTNKLLVIDGILLEFDNLKKVETKFEYSQSTITNSTSKTKKGVGKSLVGGMLFGPIGALVGGVTSNGKTKSSNETTTNTYCSSAKLILTLQNYYASKRYIELDPDYSDLKQAGCTSVEEYGEILELELNKIIENSKREEN